MPATEPGSAFVPTSQTNLDDVLCIQLERTVSNDNTIRYRSLVLQLPESRLRPHFVRVKVRVHEYIDDTLAIFHGPRRLARYDSDGQSIENAALAA